MAKNNHLSTEENFKILKQVPDNYEKIFFFLQKVLNP